MNKLEKHQNYTNETFEDIKHIDEMGSEYWYARELMRILEYKQWRRFESVIEKAKIACENSGISNFEHFANVGKTINMPKGTEKTITDYKLTRYACYLIAQSCKYLRRWHQKTPNFKFGVFLFYCHSRFCFCYYTIRFMDFIPVPLILFLLFLQQQNFGL